METQTSAHQNTATVAPLRVVAVLSALGIGFDVAANGTAPGIATPLFVAALAFALRPFFFRARETDLLLATAIVLTTFAAVHDTVVLLAVDVMGAMIALALAATAGSESIFALSILSMTRRVLHLAEAAVRTPIVAVSTVAHGAGHIERSRVRSALRIAAIVVPVLALFTGLLASADRVFGNIILPHVPALDLSGAARHAFLIVAGMGGAAVLWIASQRGLAPDRDEPERGHPLRSAEWLTVLGGLNALFATFVGVQFAFLFGGGDHVRVTRGLTYAQYARSGFFQLIAVAALIAIVVLATWDLGARETERQRRWFRWLITGLVALTAIILASAVLRLTLYEQTFGFTVARVTAYAIIAWIGIVLIALTVTIWRDARRRVVSAVLAAGVFVLIAVNIVNPEHFVAARNIARFERTHKIDIAYIGSLGADAVPASVAILPKLSRSDAATLRASLCRDEAMLQRWSSGWRSANLARAQALQELHRAHIRRCAPAR